MPLTYPVIGGIYKCKVPKAHHKDACIEEGEFEEKLHVYQVRNLLYDNIWLFPETRSLSLESQSGAA